MLVARGICGNGRPFATAKRPSTECGPTIFAHPAPAFTNDDTGTSNSTYTDLRGACRTKARQFDCSPDCHGKHAALTSQALTIRCCRTGAVR
jgi:hypothetical protein